MAVLFISEYVTQPRDRAGYLIASGAEPTVNEQQVAIAAGSAQSAAFNAKTAFVRLHTDAICHVLFGANPTAAAGTSKRMAANQTEYFGVRPGDKVAVITGS